MGYDLEHWLWFFLVGGGTGLMAGLIAREWGLGITADGISGRSYRCWGIKLLRFYINV